MTRKLFWEDMYMKEFDAKVATVDGTKVLLDQTAFNPRGGGLVSDTGMLGGIRVTEVVKEGDDIFHLMQGPAGFAVGDTVHGVLDWERRHRIMRMHTSAHILSAVVHKQTGGLITGNQISPDESRVDFNLADFDRGKIQSFVDEVNLAVGRGLEVRTFFMKREEALATPGYVKLANAMPPNLAELRIVQIGDVDTQADGGVHVGNTKEIGKVAVVKAENKGKDNRRLYFTVEQSV
ncbi:MAG TPA: alanyl-tRNA editing protein [Nitrososphaerales archaeon]|nr:alanyl-tRNA editing protein [Nitrososphaerales archaeon]